jgi:hypothetical protein
VHQAPAAIPHCKFPLSSLFHFLAASLLWCLLACVRD